MQLHTVIDLETMGTHPLSAIVSIGAAKFFPAGNGDDTIEIVDEFYINISLHSAMRLGSKIDAGTVLWWMKQDGAARNALLTNTVPQEEALVQFSEWLVKDGGSSNVWGNGPSFDNVILTSAYRAIGKESPWRYTNDRCLRTLRMLGKAAGVVDVPFEGDKHNALADAKHEARIIRNIYAKMGLKAS